MLTTARRQRPPKTTRKRALELLVHCPHEGCTEGVLLAHGFTVEQMVELVRDGLAMATAEGEVDTLWITEKGRRTLARLQL